MRSPAPLFKNSGKLSFKFVLACLPNNKNNKYINRIPNNVFPVLGCFVKRLNV